MHNLLLSVLLTIGIGTGAASTQEDVQVAQASVDQPVLQYMMSDPGGH
ncbi:complement C1q protein [Bacillus sp. Fil]